MSLKTKMLIFIGAPVLLTVMILAVVSYAYSRNLLLEESRLYLKTEAFRYASDIETIISAEISYVDILKQSLEREIPSDREIVADLTYLTENVTAAKSFYLAFEDGRYLDGEGWVPEAGYVPKERPWYKAAIDQEGIVISDPYFDTASNLAIITLSTEIKSGSKRIGVLGVDVLLSDIEKLVNGVKIKESGRAFLIDKQGNIVVHSNYQVGESLRELEGGSLRELTEQMLVQQGVTMEYKYRNQQNLYVSAAVSKTNWRLILSVPTEEVLATANGLGIFMMILGFISVVAVAVIIYFIASSIVKPISRLCDCVQGMVEYDFTLSDQSPSVIYSKRKDEIGKISRSLIHVKNTMRDVMVQLSDVVNNVTAASQQLSATSEQASRSVDDISRAFEDISQGAVSQAEDMQRGAEAMEVMQGALDENIRVVDNLNGISKEVFQANENGKIAIEELIAVTMKSRQSSEEVKQVIANTNTSAIQIESASDMIKSIADQTNLLALNAAIEAARVGEAGKGFAVVADEIRKLAEQSNTFTEEIKEIVSGLTSKTAEAVEIMEVVGKIMENQSEKVDQTKKQFGVISAEMDKNRLTVDKLNLAGEKLEETRDNLSGIIENLSALSQENAASAEEVSASLQEQTASASKMSAASLHLADMAQELADMVSKFKI